MKHAPPGRFRLCAGVEFFDADESGVILQHRPFRILRINGAAARALRLCRREVSLETDPDIPDGNPAAVQPFIDSLCQAGILEWVPPAPPPDRLVSVIVPVYNRAHEIGACLASLLALDHPRIEIIAADDGSTDDTVSAVRRHGVNIAALSCNQGQSAARNAGVRAANGDIIAFTDSDCIADPGWISELIPFFEDPRIALVGGFVDACYTASALDRYEAVKSPLNMGDKPVIGAGRESVLYVPACNMLVRKEAFDQVGGFDETRRVGEDVDLCWRLKKQGWRIMYVPRGVVRHKHRNRFSEAFGRRFDYGVSEPALYAAHPEAAKRFPWQFWGLAIFGLIMAVLLTMSAVFLWPVPLILLGETAYKKMRLEKMTRTPYPFKKIFTGAFRSHFLLIYYLSYHMVRYYLIPMVVLACLFPGLAPAAAFFLLLPAGVDYFTKKPGMLPPAFLFFFWAEQAAYQSGVFYGCIREKCFRPYRISFAWSGFLAGKLPFNALAEYLNKKGRKIGVS